MDPSASLIVPDGFSYQYCEPNLQRLFVPEVRHLPYRVQQEIIERLPVFQVSQPNISLSDKTSFRRGFEDH